MMGLVNDDEVEAAVDEARSGLSVAEAEAIATEDPDLIWLDVPDQEYRGQQRNMEPGR